MRLYDIGTYGKGAKTPYLRYVHYVPTSSYNCLYKFVQCRLRRETNRMYNHALRIIAIVRIFAGMVKSAKGTYIVRNEPIKLISR